MAGTKPVTTSQKSKNRTTMPRHHHRDHPAGGSPRQLRVGELIRHELADMFSRGLIHDPVV
jgi:ribosome-binding factor A